MAMQAAMIAALDIPVVGFKLGATSLAIRRMDGHDGPVPGRLLAQTAHASPAIIELLDQVECAVECEFSYLLQDDLPSHLGAKGNEEELLSKVSLVPAFEIIGSRVPEGLRSTWGGIADNGNGVGFVYGAPQSADLLTAAHISALHVSLRINGEERAQNMLGDDRAVPLAALAEAVRIFADQQVVLQKGQHVLTGACTVPIPASTGDEFIADFGPLGTISVRFTSS